MQSGEIGFITIEVFKPGKNVLTLADEKMLSKVWNILGHCILPDLDLVLPRMGRERFGEVFFVVACCTKDGVDALTKRIQGQLGNCRYIENAGFSSVVSSIMLDVQACYIKSSEELVKNIATKIEGLVEKTVSKRRDLYEQEKDSNRG